MRPWTVAVILLSATFLSSAPAQADFTVCNDSFDVLNVAVAYARRGDFVSEGWWNLAPQRCIPVIRGAIPARYVYLQATDVYGRLVLRGSANFCTDTGRFQIVGTGECWGRGHLTTQFSEIDTNTSTNWITILNGE